MVKSLYDAFFFYLLQYNFYFFFDEKGIKWYSLFIGSLED